MLMIAQVDSQEFMFAPVMLTALPMIFVSEP
jgi:hypothetical protein